MEQAHAKWNATNPCRPHGTCRGYQIVFYQQDAPDGAWPPPSNLAIAALVVLSGYPRRKREC
jgi:hypothetical protein